MNNVDAVLDINKNPEPKVVFELRNVCTSTLTSANLDNMNFKLFAGEVHVVVGDQAFALESLMRVLKDDLSIARGEVFFEGAPSSIHAMMYRAGEICIISDDDYLYPDFSVFDNIFYYEKMKGLKKKNYHACRKLFRDLGLGIDVDEKVGDLSLEKRKMVEIMRAFILAPKVVVMYDVMPRLGSDLSFAFASLLGKYREKGIGIIYITLQVNDAIALGDRISVLKNGSLVSSFPVEEVRSAPIKLIGAISGWETQVNDGIAQSELRFIETIALARNIMTTSNDLKETLIFLGRNLASVLEASEAIIYLINEGESGNFDSLTPQTASLKLDAQFVKQSILTNTRSVLRQPKLSGAFADGCRYAQMYCIPLPINASVNGMIQVLYKEEHAFTEQDHSYIRTFHKEIMVTVEMSTIIDHSLVIQESHHRIKNNLQVIISLLYMQENKLRETFPEKAGGQAEGIIQTTINRIKSIAAIHDLLSQDRIGWDKINLYWLISRIVEIYRNFQIDILLDVEEINIPYKKAASFALVVNELVNNCIKHAFHESQKEKRIAITCKSTGESVFINIRDNGNGLSESFDVDSCRGVGVNVVKSIAMELRATLKYESEGGTSVTMTIPRKEIYKV